jgi:tRNA A37 threonylcarbamoyltransferase TsaD
VEKALQNHKVSSISLVGGVAANKMLRDECGRISLKYKKKMIVPDLEFCGDNGAMIAYRGMRLHQCGIKYSFDFNAFPGLNGHTYIK